MFLNRNIFYGIHTLSHYTRYPLKTALLHDFPSIINRFVIDDEEIRIMQKVSDYGPAPGRLVVLEPKQFMGMQVPPIWPAIGDPLVVNFISICARPDYEDESRFGRGCRYGGTQHCKSHEDVLVAIDESTNEPILLCGFYRTLRGEPYKWVSWYAKTDGPLKNHQYKEITNW